MAVQFDGYTYSTKLFLKYFFQMCYIDEVAGTLIQLERFIVHAEILKNSLTLRGVHHGH